MKEVRIYNRPKRRKGKSAKPGLKPYILVLFCIVVVLLSALVITKNLAMEDKENAPPITR